MIRRYFEVRNFRMVTMFLAVALLPIGASADDEKGPMATAPGGGEIDKVADALSAAWPGMEEGATVVDWEGNVLQEGANGYTCLPTPPMLSGTAPMCMDTEWMKWANAWQNKGEYAAESLGISYMLSGDEGASNIDPYAEGPTDDNEWIRGGCAPDDPRACGHAGCVPDRPREWWSVRHVERHALPAPDGAGRSAPRLNE